jgi:hypothetical protein
MAIKNINFKSLVLAGFVGAYVMFFIDYWFAGTIGLFGIFPGTSNPWWMLEHHIDGIIMALPFAWLAVYRRLPGPGWVKGLVYGFVWAIVVMITMLVTGALGAKMFAGMSLTFAVGISTILTHMIWGFFLGVIYVPPKSEITVGR